MQASSGRGARLQRPLGEGGGAAADVEYCLELYRGKKHGFAVPDNAGAYDRDAADRHWRRLETFFGETLA